MQIFNKQVKGLKDAFTIKSDYDNFNNIELDFKWRILIFDDIANLKLFANTICSNAKELGNYDALTVNIVRQGIQFKNFVFYFPNVVGYILFTEKSVTDEIVAHESSHAAYCSLECSVDKVIPNSIEQQEILAYLTGQFVKSFNDEYSNRKSRARFFRTKSSTKSKRRVQRSSKKIPKGSK